MEKQNRLEPGRIAVHDERRLLAIATARSGSKRFMQKAAKTGPAARNPSASTPFILCLDTRSTSAVDEEALCHGCLSAIRQAVGSDECGVAPIHFASRLSIARQIRRVLRPLGCNPCREQGA